ncbi:hypothetical protein [Sporomusa malonica]|uniref:Uncharacterized protein n=1 Tax=Sporomusa malonica TaxID=112901 RepID=A0A1W1YQR9_9FIRM|nr:hypothetical protein [Sporomusa malonica]SMC38560.1 hypothetical protein SAMN04488500_102103 [Sporomusa malonica]
MAEGKQNINRHLNSAQQWLSEAEQAFEKDSDIRGELNLFLAQAELTHAKEANHSRYWRHKYPALRHSLAIGLAIVIAAGGMTASYLWGISRHSTLRPLQVEQSAPAAENNLGKANAASGAITPTMVQMTPASEPNASKAATDTHYTAASQQPSAPPAREESSRSVSEADRPKDVPLTPDEINKLIRLAGKSLRGQ